MPHADIKYSSDLTIDTHVMFSLIERIINEHDSSAGVCKCRAYPADVFRCTHISIDINVLPKPHRDEAFMQALLSDLETQLKAVIKQQCYFSLGLVFSPVYYVTSACAGTDPTHP